MHRVLIEALDQVIDLNANTGFGALVKILRAEILDSAVLLVRRDRNEVEYRPPAPPTPHAAWGGRRFKPRLRPRQRLPRPARRRRFA